MSRVLVVGYGTAGMGIAEDAKAHGDEVVGFLDDAKQDPRVLGRLAEVNRVVRDYAVDSVYFAIPTIDAARLREFLAGLEQTGLQLSMLPRTYETISRETVSVSDLTDVDVLQLVGREPVKHDMLDARHMVEGRRALVTGAAGSIGSRLVEHLLSLGVDTVVALDWWETGLFHLANRLDDDRLKVVVADVKNTRRLQRIFDEQRPQTGLPRRRLQARPAHGSAQSWRGGAEQRAREPRTYCRQADRVRSEPFVCVSTDKAVRSDQRHGRHEAARPNCVLGHWRPAQRATTLHCRALRQRASEQRAA